MEEIKDTLSPNNFISEINEIVKNDGVDYMDAVLHYCETKGIEIEAVAGLIKKDGVIKGKIQDEAEKLNFLPRSAKLPL